MIAVLWGIIMFQFLKRTDGLSVLSGKRIAKPTSSRFNSSSGQTAFQPYPVPSFAHTHEGFQFLKRTDGLSAAFGLCHLQDTQLLFQFLKRTDGLSAGTCDHHDCSLSWFQFLKRTDGLSAH